jgi:hypothetical protein
MKMGYNVLQSVESEPEISEEHIASIFRVEEDISVKAGGKQNQNRSVASRSVEYVVE